MVAHPLFVEACLLRAWPGNVRELIAETQRAAQLALEEKRTTVEARDLSADAGVGLTQAPAAEGAGDPEHLRIQDALRAAGGNVTRAAAALGMHRTALRRWLEKHGVEP